tara:strand:- start:13634 stop:14914 length:1281 start_codon:yes stop_codon:yes gene_type:complete
MKNGSLTRLLIAKILEKIKTSNIGLDVCFDEYFKQHRLTKPDKNLIYNVVMSTIRHINILDQIFIHYSNKKIFKKDLSYYLIISAITQICFLNFKSYAVINSTCDAYKKNKKKSVDFINGLLRNIDRNKNLIVKKNWNKSLHPGWFKKNIKNLSSNKKKAFYKSIMKQPTIHIQFKNSNDIMFIKNKKIMTSKNSLTLKENIDIKNLPGYREGKWWVQDYAATLPVKLMGNVKNKNVLDMCAAPGGKTFQLLNLKAEVTAYDISTKRIEIMKINLKRLNYNMDIINENVLNITNKNKYDFILIDAPCSAIGTIKRNPEILFRNRQPNLKLLNELQYNLLLKAADLIKNNGKIIYTVCSIFDIEGKKQIEEFLKKNKNFYIDQINSSEINNIKSLITKRGFIKTYPYSLPNIGGIDGFFIARIYKKL